MLTVQIPLLFYHHDLINLDIPNSEYGYLLLSPTGVFKGCSNFDYKFSDITTPLNISQLYIYLYGTLNDLAEYYKIENME